MYIFMQPFRSILIYLHNTHKTESQNFLDPRLSKTLVLAKSWGVKNTDLHKRT